MNGLFRRERFAGFGPCAVDDAARPGAAVRGRRSGQLRKGVRAGCPRLPGVYGMTDAAGELIYVGKARSLRGRLLSYFRKSRDDKAAKIVADARGLVWEVAPSEFAALLRELELIRRHQPRFNVQGQPRRHRRCYLCVGRRPAPYAFVTAQPPATALAVFGPVPGVRTAREAARRLNDWYRLRDCPQKQTMVFADQNELFPVLHTPGCIRHEIGSCLGPCAAACSRGDYGFHVEAVLDFLQGTDRTPLEQLQRQMNEAAVALEFERAALLRDRLRSLEWLFEHLERIRQAVRLDFVYPVDGHDGLRTWYLIRHGLVRAGVPAPRDAAGAAVVRRLLEEVYQGRAAARAPGLHEIDGVLLVAAWFRRHKAESAFGIAVEKAQRLTAVAGQGPDPDTAP